MKKIILAAGLFLGITGICFAEGGNLLIDDFEVAVSGGLDGTVDFGAGNGSSVNVTADTYIKNTGKQSLKVDYNAVQGLYIYVARGKGLDSKNANWLIKPEDIKWEDYKGFSFYMYGTDSKTRVAFDIKDNGDEIWRFVVEDNFKGWKQIVCDFDKFIVSDDWQPNSADKNAKLDFPIKIFQFEALPVSKGTLYFDTVELIKK